MVRSLDNVLNNFDKIWRRDRHAWNYGRCLREFDRFWGYLLRKGKCPSALQYEGLYRILRYEDKCGTEAKKRILRQGFPDKLINNMSDHCGCFGGALGSIHRNLTKSTQRERFWRVLSALGKSDTVEQADKHIREYSLNPVGGIGIGICSSFFWAIRPKWYPIVNNLSRDKMCVIEGFPRAMDLKSYITLHVPRLRGIRVKLGLKDFSSFDRFFIWIVEKGIRIRPAEKLVFQTEEEKVQAIAEERILEGRRIESRRNSPERKPKLRQRALERGYDCQICGFSFERFYGIKFAEVHHIQLLSRGGVREIEPDKDLLVVCSNCHSILHPSPHGQRDWRELRKIVAS
ncbi:MAG: HNH endonuclease [Planctomycetota bacterium]